MSAHSRFISRISRRVLGISALLAVLTAVGCSSSNAPAAPTAPNLSGAVTPQGAFNPNKMGAYEIVVSNAAGALATTGTVTVTDPDTNFTVTTITGGNGSLWVCVTLTCTRSDSLAPGTSYDPIFVTGTVGAGPGAVGIQITITAGNETSPVSSPATIPIVTPLTMSKAFNPATIILGANSALTFTITNPAFNTVAQTGVAFTDTLPAGLAVATPNGLATTCGGTATAAAGSSSISLTGGTVGVNTNCTLTVNVTGAATGVNITNTSGTVSSTNGGTGNAASASITVNNPVPAITSLSPATAVVGGPAFTLTVNGTGFVSTSVVAFNGSNRATTFVSATQVTASILVTDIATTGTPPVTVANPAPGGGTSAPVNFPVNNPVPAITSLAPSSATVGAAAQTLTINGSNFLAASTVTYNGVAHAATFVNSTQLTIQLTAPDQATAGTDAVVVSNLAPGGGPSNSVNFAVNNPVPTITSLSPLSASAGAAAQTLTINGTNFVSTSTVTYHGVAHAATFVSGTQLTIQLSVADQATGGTFPVAVTNPAPGGGTSTPAATFTVNNLVPTITTLSPPSGTTGAAAQTLTINGTNFVSTSTVTYNGVAHAATFVSSTQLTIQLTVADQATAGTDAVVVTSPAPGGGASNSVNFAVNNPAPTITTLSPSTAVVAGPTFTLTVNGTGVVSTSVVNFNSVAQTTTFVSATQVTASIPATDIASTGLFPVTVTSPTPGGGTSPAVNFSVTNPPPVITSLSPMSATEGGATFTLTVNGTAFISGATVNFNSVAETTTFVNATQITASIPSTAIAAAGTFPVTVTNPAPGGGTSAPTNFIVDNPAPTITSLSPPSVGEGAAAQTLTINGTNFVSTSTVTYNGVAHAATFVSSAQLTIQLTVADQATAGTDAVVVTNPAPGGGAATPLNFTVNNPAPTITSLSPPSASAGAAAQTLTINGTNFVSTSTVTYNGVAHAATFLNDTQLTIQLTAGNQATGGSFPVVVTNPAPGGGMSNSVNFTVNNLAPTITTLSPSSAGQGSAAQALTINGTNFVSTSTVTYNAVAHAATFVSSTQLTITLTVGDQATAGTFPVVVTSPAPGGGTSNSVNFTVTNFATQITNLFLHPDDVTSPGTSTATAIFNGPAPSSATLTLGSTNTSAATVPTTMPIPTGATSVNFTITELGVNSPATTSISASASFGGTPQSKTLTVNPSGSVYLTSLTLSPSTVDASPTVTGSFGGTVSLNENVTSNTTVTLSSSNNSAAIVPPNVTVLAGQSSIGFTLTVPTGTSFLTSTITATLNGGSETALLTVDPAGTPIVSSLVLNPTAVVGGAATPNGTSTGTVTLSAAPASNTPVTLLSEDANLTVPPTVTVLAGQTTATFPITTSAVTLNDTVTIVASDNGSTSTTLNVNATLAITSSATPLPIAATTITYLGTGTATTPGFQLKRSGGVGSFTWSPVTPLPAGLSLSGSGLITGTPTNVSATAAGTSFEVQIADHEVSPVTVNATLAITVVNPASACANVVAGTINDALVSGRYQIEMNAVQGGTTTGTPVAEAGSVFFNGSGGIGSSGAQLGEVDINLASGPQHLTITGGSYAVNTSGQGCFQVTYSGGALTGQVFHFVMNPVLNASNIAVNGTIMEFDAYQGSNGGTATILGSGLIRIANTTEFSNSSVSAHVAFGGHGRDSSGLPIAEAASFTQNGNNTSATITNFEEDYDDAGNILTLTQAEFSSITLASTATTATTGREIFTSTTIPADGSVTSLTAAYIVNSNEAYLADISQLNSNNGITAGVAIRTFSTFAASDFSGTFEFRQTGDDATGTNGNCPSPPCLAVNLGVITPNPGTLMVTGTSFDEEGGPTNTNPISNAYTFNTTFGVIRLTNAMQAPAIYVADPATGMDATDPDAAFLVGSGPTLNSNTGDPTASSGVAVGPLPAAPYTLNNGPYVFSTDDGADLLLNYSTGAATFSTSTESLAITQDIAGTAGLTINSTALTLNFNFTPPTGDAAGIVTATNPANGNVLPGTTNSSASSPGDAHVIQGGLIRNIYP